MTDRNGDAARESKLASGWKVEATAAPVGEPADDARPTSAPVGGSPSSEASSAGAPNQPNDAPQPAVSAQMSNVSLILLGVFGGIYLIYTWVWFSWAEFYAGANEAVAAASGSLGAILQQVIFWAAPFAPATWFISVLRLTTKKSEWKRALWILVGAVALFPLPLLGGA